MDRIEVHPLSNSIFQHKENQVWELDDTTIDTWYTRVPDDIDPSETLLTSSEIDKANRLKNKLGRIQYITARNALRYLSAKYTKAKTGELVCMETEGEKPRWYFPNDQLHFNIAHSGEHILISFARCEIGVDMEIVNEGFLYKDIINRYFSTEEMNSIGNSHAFYLSWTRKEALLKAAGTGIHDEIAIIPSLEGKHVSGFGNWMVDSFYIKENVIASVAYHHRIRTKRYFILDEAMQ